MKEVCQALQDNLDNLVKEDLQDQLAHKVHLDQLDQLENLALLDRLDPPDHLEIQDNVVFQVRQVHQVCKVSVDLQVYLGLLDLLVLQENVGNQDQLVKLVSVVKLEQGDSQDLQVFQERGVPLVFLDLQVLLENEARQEKEVNLENKDNVGNREREVHLDKQVHRDHLDLPVKEVFQEAQD